jgi:Domain of unknown function (DUF309)
MTLPLPQRNRLAKLILEAFHDPRARRELEALAADRSEGARPAELSERAARARELLEGCPLETVDAGLETALRRAALLFDGHFYFEVHELLEPYWLCAGGREREMLQGLIQISAGFHHLDSGNAAGARALLREGAGKLLGGGAIGGMALDAFARAVISISQDVIRLGAEAPARFLWSSVPPFPRFPPLASKDINLVK